MKHVITKGSDAWRNLFYDNDTASFWGTDHATDRIFAEGDPAPLLNPDRPKVIVCGSRLVEYDDIMNIRSVVRALSENPFNPVIVSGLAVGTDSHVHEAALDFGLPTVAVLPCGLDDVYPHCNRPLAERIRETEGCALLSQFPERTDPQAINFLIRNRTMAMVSDLAVIVSGRKKSGSVTVATLMSLRNRRSLAIPGRITDDRFRGCNSLIRYRIADIFTDESFDFLKTFSVTRKESEYHND